MVASSVINAKNELINMTNKDITLGMVDTTVEVIVLTSVLSLVSKLTL